ncbi:MAG: hypothetical protein R3B09_23935 [Nannocystaceae bacterium]
MSTTTRHYLDPRLGDLTITREEGSGPQRWCLWSGEARLDGQAEPFYLSLSGDPRRPDRGLTDAVYQVLDGIEAIAAKVDAQLAARGIRATFADFRVSVIGDWDTLDEVLQVDLLPRVEGALAEDLEVYWPGENWQIAHHIVLRAKDYTRRSGG